MSQAIKDPISQTQADEIIADIQQNQNLDDDTKKIIISHTLARVPKSVCNMRILEQLPSNLIKKEQISGDLDVVTRIVKLCLIPENKAISDLVQIMITHPDFILTEPTHEVTSNHLKWLGNYSSHAHKQHVLPLLQANPPIEGATTTAERATLALIKLEGAFVTQKVIGKICTVQMWKCRPKYKPFPGKDEIPKWEVAVSHILTLNRTDLVSDNDLKKVNPDLWKKVRQKEKEADA